MDKYIKSESVRSVLYFLLMMGAIFGIQSLNKLFLPWSMLGIFILIFLFIFKITGAGKEVFLPSILVTGFIFFVVVLFTAPGSERGVESYIENKYNLKPYQVIKCDYFGLGNSMPFSMPLRCVVPGYPKAEKDANLIIEFIILLTYSPILIGAVAMAAKFSWELKK